MSNTSAKQIIRATLLVGLGHVLFKIAGLIQAMVMGRFIPTEIYEVVYTFAFNGCILGLFFTFEEVIGPVFLPLFIRERDSRGESDAWNFASSVLSIQFGLLLLLIALLTLFPGFVARVVTLEHWNSQDNPEKYALAISSLRRLAPALLGLSLGSTTYMLLNGYKRFFLAALGDAVWKYTAIVFVAIGVAVFNRGVDMLILGLIIGSLAKLATHLLGLRDKLHKLRLQPKYEPALLAELGKLAAPLIVGILFAKYRDLFNGVTVFSALDQAGLMQANEFGRKLVGAISVIIPYTIAIALFPFLCDMIDRNNRQELADTLTNSGRLVLSVLLPLSFVMAALSTPITRFLFEGGEFGADSVRFTAAAMACYSLYLPAAALEPMLMQAFFADKRTVAITVVGIVFSSLSMVISLVGVVLLRLEGVAAIMTVACGFTVSRTLKAIVLVLLMRRSAPVFPLASSFLFFGRIIIVGVTCSFAAFLASVASQRALRGVDIPALSRLKDAQLESLPALAAGGLAASIIFVLAVWLLRIEEPRTMLRWALRRGKETR